MDKTVRHGGSFMSVVPALERPGVQTSLSSVLSLKPVWAASLNMYEQTSGEYTSSLGKVLATNPDDVSSIPRTHMVEGED